MAKLLEVDENGKRALKIIYWVLIAIAIFVLLGVAIEAMQVFGSSTKFIDITPLKHTSRDTDYFKMMQFTRWNALSAFLLIVVFAIASGLSFLMKDKVVTSIAIAMGAALLVYTITALALSAQFIKFYTGAAGQSKEDYVSTLLAATAFQALFIKILAPLVILLSAPILKLIRLVRIPKPAPAQSGEAWGDVAMPSEEGTL